MGEMEEMVPMALAYQEILVYSCTMEDLGEGEDLGETSTSALAAPQIS